MDCVLHRRASGEGMDLAIKDDAAVETFGASRFRFRFHFSNPDKEQRGGGVIQRRRASEEFAD